METATSWDKSPLFLEVTQNPLAIKEQIKKIKMACGIENSNLANRGYKEVNRVLPHMAYNTLNVSYNFDRTLEPLKQSDLKRGDVKEHSINTEFERYIKIESAFYNSSYEQMKYRCDFLSIYVRIIERLKYVKQGYNIRGTDVGVLVNLNQPFIEPVIKNVSLEDIANRELRTIVSNIYQSEDLNKESDNKKSKVSDEIMRKMVCLTDIEGLTIYKKICKEMTFGVSELFAESIVNYLTNKNDLIRNKIHILDALSRLVKGRVLTDDGLLKYSKFLGIETESASDILTTIQNEREQLVEEFNDVKNIFNQFELYADKKLEYKPVFFTNKNDNQTKLSNQSYFLKNKRINGAFNLILKNAFQFTPFQYLCYDPELICQKLTIGSKKTYEDDEKIIVDNVVSYNTQQKQGKAR